MLEVKVMKKQAGTGPSRRHTQGSKIAKRHPSVKYSFLQYSKIENFSKKNKLKKNGPSGALKSHNAKKLKGGTLRGFSTSILSQNIKKMQGGPFGLARYGMLRGKTGKTFLVRFARPNSAIWCNNVW